LIVPLPPPTGPMQMEPLDMARRISEMFAPVSQDKEQTLAANIVAKKQKSRRRGRGGRRERNIEDSKEKATVSVGDDKTQKNPEKNLSYDGDITVNITNSGENTIKPDTTKSGNDVKVAKNLVGEKYKGEDAIAAATAVAAAAAAAVVVPDTSSDKRVNMARILKSRSRRMGSDRRSPRKN